MGNQACVMGRLRGVSPREELSEPDWQPAEADGLVIPPETLIVQVVPTWFVELVTGQRKHLFLPRDLLVVPKAVLVQECVCGTTYQWELTGRYILCDVLAGQNRQTDALVVSVEPRVLEASLERLVVRRRE